MRTFTVSDPCASELWTALNGSTAAPNASTTPPARGATAPTAPATQTEAERVIFGAQYTPVQAGFPNGWPPYDPDQSSATHKDTDYIHTGTQSGFYTFPGFAERQSKPLPNINTGANPRSGPGLLAVFMTVGPTPEFRAKAFNALVAGGGDYTKTINANSQADPPWNAQVAQMLAGTPPATAELQAAKAVADSL